VSKSKSKSGRVGSLLLLLLLCCCNKQADGKREKKKPTSQTDRQSVCEGWDSGTRSGSGCALSARQVDRWEFNFWDFGKTAESGLAAAHVTQGWMCGLGGCMRNQAGWVCAAAKAEEQLPTWDSGFGSFSSDFCSCRGWRCWKCENRAPVWRAPLAWRRAPPAKRRRQQRAFFGFERPLKPGKSVLSVY
jgi:hypothetical protein